LYRRPQQGRPELVRSFGRMLSRRSRSPAYRASVRFPACELPTGSAWVYVSRKFRRSVFGYRTGTDRLVVTRLSRYFQTPLAWYEDRYEPYELIAKFGGALLDARLEHSPFDVVTVAAPPCSLQVRPAPLQYTASLSFATLTRPSFCACSPSPTRRAWTNIRLRELSPRWARMEHTFRPAALVPSQGCKLVSWADSRGGGGRPTCNLRVFCRDAPHHFTLAMSGHGTPRRQTFERVAARPHPGLRASPKPWPLFLNPLHLRPTTALCAGFAVYATRLLLGLAGGRESFRVPGTVDRRSPPESQRRPTRALRELD